MKSLSEYKAAFETYLKANEFQQAPQALYEPNNYILQLGGKRLRPCLVLLACELFGTDFNKALPAALSIEYFHNFSLIHDDIMDAADLRRGKPTVHKKYNTNDAILSGDVLLVFAYQHLQNYDAELMKKLMSIFSKTAIEVCEGQSDDTSFEQRNDVTEVEYIEMIRNKTAVLLAASLKIGALIGGASEKEAQLLYEYGESLGVAFQIQDDILDTYGDEKVGKLIGGDIVQNKKTLLLIKAAEHSRTNKDEQLDNWLTKVDFDNSTKIEAVKSIFEQYNVLDYALAERNRYVDKALSALQQINQDSSALVGLVDALVKRDF